MIAIAPPPPVVSPANVQVDKPKAVSPLVRPATFKRRSPALRLSTLRDASLLAANRKAAHDSARFAERGIAQVFAANESNG
jgi:hypothetical protein